MADEHKHQTETLYDLYDPDPGLEKQSRKGLGIVESFREQLLRLLLEGKDVTSTIEQLYKFGKDVISLMKMGAVLHPLEDEHALLMDTYYLTRFLQERMNIIKFNDHFEPGLEGRQIRDEYLKLSDPYRHLKADGLKIVSTDARNIDWWKIKFNELFFPKIKLIDTRIIDSWEKEFIELFRKENIPAKQPSLSRALCSLAVKIYHEKSTMLVKSQSAAENLVNKIYIVVKTIAGVDLGVDYKNVNEAQDFFTKKPAEIDDMEMADIDQDSKTIANEQALEEKNKTTTSVSPENSSQLSQTVSLQEEPVNNEIVILVGNCITVKKISKQKLENKESSREVRKKQEEECSDTLRQMENVTLASNMLDEEKKTIAKQDHSPKEKHISGSNSSSSSSSSSTSAATSSRIFFPASNSSSQSSSSSASEQAFDEKTKTTTPVFLKNSSQLSQTVSLQRECVDNEIALLIEHSNVVMNILEQLPEDKVSLREVRKKKEEELSDTLKQVENLTLASNMLDEEEKTIAKQDHPPKEKHISGSNSSSSSSSSSTSAVTSSRTFFSSSNSSSQPSSSSLSSTRFSSQPKDKDINSMENLIQRESELLKQIEYHKELIQENGNHSIFRSQPTTRVLGTLQELVRVRKKIDDKKSEQSTQMRVLQG